MQGTRISVNWLFILHVNPSWSPLLRIKQPSLRLENLIAGNIPIGVHQSLILHLNSSWSPLLQIKHLNEMKHWLTELITSFHENSSELPLLQIEQLNSENCGSFEIYYWFSTWILQNRFFYDKKLLILHMNPSISPSLRIG